MRKLRTPAARDVLEIVKYELVLHSKLEARVSVAVQGKGAV